jgi:uncharacterized protein YukE
VRTETRLLVQHASELVESAYAMHGMWYYLHRVGSVPAWAWGEMPWSQRWRQDWDRAADNRITEAATMRDQMGEAGGRLLAVAANYEHADVTAAVTMDAANPDTAPYLHAYVDGSAPVTARAGGPAPAPAYPPHAMPLQIPPDDRRWQGLIGEQQPHIGYGLRSDVDGDTQTSVEWTMTEHDGLDAFVHDWFATLNRADQVVEEFAPGTRRPFQDIILPAWQSAPSVIENRAQLVGSASHTYEHVGRDVGQTLAQVAKAWQGPAADAYTEYAATSQDYLERITGQVSWLGSEGIKTANLLRELRNQYAQIAARHVERIQQLTDQYFDLITSSVGRLFSCTSPKEAAQQLLEEVQAMNAELSAEENAKLGQAKDLLDVEATAIAGRPELGDFHHDTETFPANALDTPAWGSGWSKK